MSLYDSSCTKCLMGSNGYATCIHGIGSKRKDIDIVVVMDAPSIEEGASPFSDNRARLLARMFKQVGLNPGASGKVWFTYVHKCAAVNPKTNRAAKVKLKDAKICAEAYLEQEIKIINPKIILCLGKVVQSVVLKNNTSVAHTRGKLVKAIFGEWEGLAMVLDHPFAILQSPAKESMFIQDLQGVVKVLKGESPFWEKSKQHRFDFVPITSVNQFIQIKEELFKTQHKYLAIDVEASGLGRDLYLKDFKVYTLQFGVVDLANTHNNYTNPVYILPIQSKHFLCTQQNDPGWICQIKPVINNLLSRKRFHLVAHNGKYDLKALRSAALGVYSYLQWDTMMLWANFYGEASMSLKEIAYQITDIGGYDKEMEAYFKEHGSYDAPQDILLPYGGLDIVVTRLLLQKLLPMTETSKE